MVETVKYIPGRFLCTPQVLLTTVPRKTWYCFVEAASKSRRKPYVLLSSTHPPPHPPTRHYGREGVVKQNDRRFPDPMKEILHLFNGKYRGRSTDTAHLLPLLAHHLVPDREALLVQALHLPQVSRLHRPQLDPHLRHKAEE